MIGEMEAAFQQAQAEWREHVMRIRRPEETRFLAMQLEADALRASGRWVSGPGDLLTVLGRHRDELVHSRLIGWLLLPSGRHGLGDRFLRSFLQEAIPGVVPNTRSVGVALEVTRSGMSGATRGLVEARADLVLTLQGLVVVVENKVDAGEQADQCERLYWPWAADPVETYWVFLSPSGRSPVTASSDTARGAWRSMSYGQVRRALKSALDAADGVDDEPGRATAYQYLTTLAAQG